MWSRKDDSEPWPGGGPARGRTDRGLRHHLRRFWKARRGLLAPWQRRRGRGAAEVRDLRAPLNAIRTYSEILLNHPELSPKQRAHYLTIIFAESQRLERGLEAVDGLEGR